MGASDVSARRYVLWKALVECETILDLSWKDRAVISKDKSEDWPGYPASPSDRRSQPTHATTVHGHEVNESNHGTGVRTAGIDHAPLMCFHVSTTTKRCVIEGSLPATPSPPIVLLS